MKGTTIIELTDAKTGKVEKTVDHNYFTNALKYYFGNGSELSPSPFGCGAGSDWIYNLLGGVMLFDETMTGTGVEVVSQASPAGQSNNIDYQIPLNQGQTATISITSGSVEDLQVGWGFAVYGRIETVVDGEVHVTADPENVIRAYDESGTATYTASANCVVIWGIRTYNGGGAKITVTGITNDPEIIEPQLGVGMTANAVRGVLNSGDPTELGSWNETESGWQADGTYRMVFDWTTSQGNGTIKSVCLAPRYFAYEGIGNKSNSYQTPSPGISANHYSNSRSRNETGFPVALYDNAMWTMSDGTPVYYYPQEHYIDISSKTKLTFHQYSLALTEADLRGTPSAGQQYDDVEVDLPNALQAANMYIRRWQQRGSHLYMLCSTGTAYTDTFYILDINLSTKAVAHTYTIVPSTLGSQASNDRLMAITDTHFLYNDVCIDYTANTSVAVTYSTANPACAVTIGDRFYTTLTTANLYILDCIDPSTGEGYPVNRMGADLDYESKNYSNMLLWNIGYGEKLMLYTYYNWTCYRNPRFLSTINNLSQTVTKTADKTMKVTYVLDFSDEEEAQS